MWWLLFAFGSALFAGVTAILAKAGVKNVNSTLATAIRTIVVLIFSWIMVFITGSYKEISSVDVMTMLWLCLSGVATGASWLCYFRALQLGDVNKVSSVDKSSTVFAVLFAFIFLHEKVSVYAVAGLVFIAVGTVLMSVKKREEKTVPAVLSEEQNDAEELQPIQRSAQEKTYKWFVYALLSAVFAALTSLLSKMGVQKTDSTLATAIRTIVVLVMAWIMVFVEKKQSEIKNIDKKSLAFILLSGVATGASWICYFKALQDGVMSVVVPVDKLSILVTVSFSRLVYKEKLSATGLVGLCLLTAGTLLLIVPTGG